MPKSTELIAAETWDIRLKMWQLMSEGKSEAEALLVILPDDRHRRRKLQLWKQKNLFPPPEIEQEKQTQVVSPVTQFDGETAKALQEIADIYRRGRLDISATEIRPIFRRSETIARSIRLDKQMLKAAEKQAQRDRGRTGGTLNGLIEWLLWEYLGKDPRFTKSEE